MRIGARVVKRPLNGVFSYLGANLIKRLGVNGYGARVIDVVVLEVLVSVIEGVEGGLKLRDSLKRVVEIGVLGVAFKDLAGAEWLDKRARLGGPQVGWQLAVAIPVIGDDIEGLVKGAVPVVAPKDTVLAVDLGGLL